MQKVLFTILKAFVWTLSKLPFWALYGLSDFLFILIYHLIGYRKKVVYNNLKLVFSDWEETKLKKTRKAFYRHFCDFVVETIKSYTISEAQADKRFVYTNLELLDPIWKQERSVILWCGHYSSWEWCGILQKYIPVQGYAVYKKMDNASMDALVRKIRGRFGAIIISNKQVVPTLFRDKKNGVRSMTLMLSDQTPRPTVAKHWDEFMGIEVPVFTGGEELGKRLNMVHLYLKVSRVKRGHYQGTFVPLEPVEGNPFPITRSFLNEVENQIKEKPEHYFWSHKRWKYRKQD